MVWINHGLRWSSVAALAVALAACGGDDGAGEQPRAGAAGEGSGMSVIEGEVFYRERIMLRPGAELEVQLEDISRADALATVITTVTYTLEGGPPYPFSIQYDPTRIDPRMRYALRARITENGALRFTNTEYIDPFAASPISIMVSAVARPREPQAGEASASAVTQSGASEEQGDGGIVWTLETLEGQPAPLGMGGRPIELQLDAAESRVAGFSGCNRYTGSFNNDGNSTHGTPIQFGPMAGTLMACPEGEDTERRYLQALGRVDAYRMDGEKLMLLAGDDVVATYTTR
jgi:putative lipoprotein